MYQRCQENCVVNGEETGSSVDAPNMLSPSSSSNGINNLDFLVIKNRAFLFYFC